MSARDLLAARLSTDGGVRVDHIEPDIKAAINEFDRLFDAARAFDELAICYRIGKRPTEKLFKRLAKARETLNALEAGR
jgi:hypothetical protein